MLCCVEFTVSNMSKRVKKEGADLMEEVQVLILYLFNYFGSDVTWIKKNQEQLQRFITVSFLEAMLTHLRKADALSSAEEATIKEAAGLRDQINTLTNIITSKDNHGPSSVLLNFIEGSESQVAQLIRHHGKRTNKGIASCAELKTLHA